jgi:hypothetical protein
VFAVVVAGQVLPLLPYAWSERLKDTGLATYAALVLWLTACVVLRRGPAGACRGAPRPAEVPAAA